MQKYDLIIAGGGPAGLTAAIYARQAGLSCAVFEGLLFGGQITQTPDIRNYAGFGEIAGYELAAKMEAHAKDSGAELIRQEIQSLSLSKAPFTIVTRKGEYEAAAVILAMGGSRRKLGIPGEDKFAGRGVSYCAVCDGSFFKEKRVVVVGGGNTALEDALYLANICAEVILIHRRGEFRGEKYLVSEVLASDKIKIIYDAAVTAIEGSVKVESVTVNALKTGGETKFPADAVFVAIGTVPRTDLVKGQIELSTEGRIVAGEDTHTSAAGVFAAGDIRTKRLYQVATACSDGAVAATAAAQFVRSDRSL